MAEITVGRRHLPRVETDVVAWGAFLAILIVAIFFRINDLTATSIWMDEAVSISQSSGSFEELIRQTAGDNYPPLHNILLFVSFHIFGNTEVAARLPSVLVSLLDVVLVFAFALRCGYRNAGLIAAAIVATSAFHIWYAQEARMYALLSFASTWFAWASLRFVQQPDWRRAPWVLLASVALLYSHPFGLLNWGAIGLGALVSILVWAPRRWSTTIRYAALGIATALLFLPWALVTLRRAEAINSGGFWIRFPDLPYLRTELSWLFSGDLGALTLALGVALLVLSIFWKGGAADEPVGATALPTGIAILASWAVLPLVVALIASYLFQPVVLARYLIASIPAVALLASLGLARMSGSRAYIAALIVAAVGVGLYGQDNYNARREDWRSAAAYLEGNVSPEDCVIAYPWFTSIPLSYYFKNPPECFVAQPFNDATLPETSGAGRVFVVQFLAAGVANILLPALHENGFISTSAQEFSGVRVETLETAAPQAVAQVAPPPGDGLVIQLQAWGQTYLEPPTFDVLVDGRLVGSGTVAAVTPSTTESFSFSLDAGTDPEDVEIALTNDNFAGAGKDVNLYVTGLSIGNTKVDLAAVDLSDLEWTQHLDTGGILIGTNHERLTVPRPADGWQ